MVISTQNFLASLYVVQSILVLRQISTNIFTGLQYWDCIYPNVSGRDPDRFQYWSLDREGQSKYVAYRSSNSEG